MSSFNECEPEIRQYISKHRLNDFLESLLAGLIVNKPEDPSHFSINALSQIIEDKSLLKSLSWSTFINDNEYPNDAFLAKDITECFWYHEDERYVPTHEMYEIAYGFYNRKLTLNSFLLLKNNWEDKIKKRKVLLQKLTDARSYYSERLMKCQMTNWITWIRAVKAKQEVLFRSIKTIFNRLLKLDVFVAWQKIAADARKTREYFERIGRDETPDGNSTVALEDTDHISQLPKKVSVLVFSFISFLDLISCSQVCRHWKIISQETSLWSRIDLSKVKQKISEHALTRFIRKCRPFLCHLNLCGSQLVTPYFLKAVAECKNLQDLNLMQCSGVNNNTIKDIASGCSSLLFLNLSNTEISDSALKSLSRYCNNLQFLNLSYCLNFTDKGLNYLSVGKGCEKLAYLDLSGCTQITPVGCKDLSRGCSRLNSISFNDLPLLSDDHVQALLLDCKTLRSFYAIQSCVITDASIKTIASSRRLQTFKIEGNNRLTDSAIKNMCRSCPDLRHLYIVDCPKLTDSSMKAIGQCKQLQVLNLADCTRMTDIGVRYVIEGSSGCKLRELNLTNCSRVSDVALLRISQKCLSLTYINLSYCDHITDAGVELLAMMTSLVSIDLSGCNIQDPGISALGNNSRFVDIILSECTSITDTGIQKMVQQLQNLDNFDISSCGLLTDQSIKSLAFCCRRLRNLNISSCQQLTDSSIQYLSSVCVYLESIDMSACPMLTDKSLRYLRKGCNQLKELSIMHCSGFTREIIQKMTTKISYVYFDDEDQHPSYNE